MPRPPFKHMSPYDIPLFGAFVLSEEGRRYHTWSFDERVGPSTDPGLQYSPAARRDAEFLSRVRIDAVGWDGNGPTVFEVKPDARLSALGQIVAYRHFWCKDKGLGCRGAIITDSKTPYSEQIYAEMGIKLYIVQPVGPLDLLRAIGQVRPNSPLRYEDIAYLYDSQK